MKYTLMKIMRMMKKLIKSDVENDEEEEKNFDEEVYDDLLIDIRRRKFGC